MTRDESVAVYDQARAAVEALRQRLGTAGLGERVIAGLTRAERGAANRDGHRLAQFERAVSQPPTWKQRQMLHAMGYRGPVPANRAEVAALVSAIRAEDDRLALAPFAW